MREIILQFPSEIGVTGVTGVTGAENINKSAIFGAGGTVTPAPARGVPSVTAPGAVHLSHPAQNAVYQENFNKIRPGTPVTPGTPDFVQDFINNQKGLNHV